MHSSKAPSKRLEPPTQIPSRSIAGIIVAFIVFSAVCVVLTFLTLGFFGYVLILGGVLAGIGGLHYLVWGWWLGRVVRDAHNADETDALMAQRITMDK